ncbi:39415_t:CDS:10 [Gigaspora margarita]|uniref:39415_t:CDS:1 n=1 Tax=Gigaspora margarita TaxID=4874 RepID=A0ABN7UPP9_GIGMA|nr:39415_t:CDS:10 [Gigaspora margarita]
MTSRMITDELMIEVVRLPLTKLRVAESTEYNQELEGYLSRQEFLEKIQAFNSISLKLSINRMIIQIPLVFVITTFILCVVAVKTLSPFADEERIIIGIVLVILLISVIFMFFFTHQKGKHISSLSTLIQEFNKDDNKRNVNWKLYNESRSRLPPAYQMDIVIHDNENAVRDTEDSPPYEEFTSPPSEACAKEFAKVGSNLILTARRIDRLNELKQLILSEHPNLKVYTRQLDVRDKSTVDQLVPTLPSDLKDIDVLVNNAGLVKGMDKIGEVSSEDIDTMIDTNVKGLLYVTQAVLPRMKERQKGHIINIGSISGKQVYPNGGVYCASKHAVNAISRTLLNELVDTPIRVTEINPGMVETEFSVIRFGGDKSRADKVYDGLTPLTGEDIASRPDHVNIADVTVYPVNQASVSSVYRPNAKK